MSVTQVRKRDGAIEDYSPQKIKEAVLKAARAVGGNDEEKANKVMELVNIQVGLTGKEIWDVEELQDLVEKSLVENGHYRTAKEYITYRRYRSDVRYMQSHLNKTIENIVLTKSADSDDKRENANINTDCAMGGMLKVGSSVMKEFNLRSITKPKHAQMHREGSIHIHDLDFASFCINCLSIPLGKLLRNGFNTGHGSIRRPTTIGAASTLTCIVIQSSQNDFFNIGDF